MFPDSRVARIVRDLGLMTGNGPQIRILQIWILRQMFIGKKKLIPLSIPNILSSPPRLDHAGFGAGV